MSEVAKAHAGPEPVQSESQDPSPDTTAAKIEGQPLLERQDSVDIFSGSSSSSIPAVYGETGTDTPLSLTPGFTEDSLNIDSGSDREISDQGTARLIGQGKGRVDSDILVEQGDSEGSDTETDNLNTVKHRESENSGHSSLDRERQEDLDIFGLPPDYYARYEDEEEEKEGEFFFDSDLNLDCDIEDQIVAAELLRPERLDTVEEVSEPPSNSNSLPHDGWRWPEQLSQHTSITSTDQLASLTSLGEEDREELYSVSELEFRNSIRSQHSLTSLDRSCTSLPSLQSGPDNAGHPCQVQVHADGPSGQVQVLRSQLSDDRTLSQIEQLGKKVGLEPENLTYVKNPFEIFHSRQNIPTQQYPEKVQLGSRTVTETPQCEETRPGSIGGVGNRLDRGSVGTGIGAQEDSGDWNKSSVEYTRNSDRSDRNSHTSDRSERNIGAIHISDGTSKDSDRSEKNTDRSDASSTDRSGGIAGERSGETSERLARQLEEVRQGIYRLLSESDSGEVEEEVSTEEIDTGRQVVTEHRVTRRQETVVKTQTVLRSEVTSYSDLGVVPLEEETPGYQADEEVDQSEEESGSQSVEINSVVVPVGAGETVEEKQDLELCEKEMGCVSGERETRDKEDRGTDSGIERGGGRSRGGSAEGWLARLSSRVSGRSRVALGSGGQSSDSQASSPDGRRGSMDSPREGGFGEGSLEQRVRELWVRLAQMEAEKLRAVEQAVEEERKIGAETSRKDKIVLDREKEYILKEKEQLRREREDTEQQMRRYVESQARQTDLVNRLQAKLVKYRDEAVEGGDLVEQLTAQAKADHQNIRHLQGEVEEHQQQFQTQQVLHASEIQELQIQLEEGVEKTRTIDGVASVLREQLDISRGSVDKLEQELLLFKDELTLSKRELDIVSGSGHGGLGARDLVEVSRSLASSRRDYQEMRHETVKELNRVRLEMAEKVREMSTACLNVYTSSQYIMDSDGKQILVGSIKELWEKLERTKLEKVVEEERADQLETERDQAVREVHVVEKRMEEMRYNLDQSSRKDNVNDETNVEREPARIGKLEAENVLLRGSMQDIASMVVTDSTHESTFFLSPSRPRPLLPGRFTSTPRRSRSCDPGMVESTVSAVQAVLNRRQTQVYELQTKLSSIKDKLEQVNRNRQEWEEKHKEVSNRLGVKTGILATAEREGELARMLVEDLQTKLEKIEGEQREASHKLGTAREEMDSLRRQVGEEMKMKEIIGRELLELKEKTVIKEEELNQKTKLLREKDNRLLQLENEGMDLREESTGLRERLAAVERDQERLEMERTDKETTIIEEKKIRSHTIIEINKIKKQEMILQERLVEQETTQNKLREEVSSSEAAIQCLKLEVLNYEKKLAEKESEITKLRMELTEKQKSKEEVDLFLKHLRREKNDLGNQLTSVKLRKDALEDENVHLKEELQEIKDLIDLVHHDFAATALIKEQLAERILDKEREVKEMDFKIRTLETELEKEEMISEDWRLECEAEDQRNKELMEENEKKNETTEQLNKTIVNQKSKLFEANRKLSELQERVETEFENEKKKLEKNLKKMKDENCNIRRDLEDEMGALKDKLEKKKLADIDGLNHINKLEKERLEEEIDYLNQQIENLRSKNTESFLIAENSRTTAEKMARTEESLAEEKMNQLTKTIDLMRKEVNSERKESQKKFDKESTNCSELQIEVSKLKRKLDEENSEHKKEKETLNIEIRQIKSEKMKVEQHMSEFRAEAQISKNSIEELKRKLSRTKDDKDKLEEELENNYNKILNLENQISEKNHRIQEKILEKHKEVEILEKKIEIFQQSEKVLIDELTEIKEVYEKSQMEESSSKNVVLLQPRISELTLELEMLRKRVLDEEGGQDREERTIAELRRKLTSTEFEKSKLENYLAEVRDQVEVEVEAKTSQMTALQNSLIDVREREKRLEEVRHRLELELTSRNQEQQELVVRLQAGEGKIREMAETISRLEQNRMEADTKLVSIGQALGQVGVGSRVGTPTRGRSRLRSGGRMVGGETVLEVETVRNNVRDLVVRVERVEKEKEELTGRLEMLKLANENLVLNTGRLEEEKETVLDRLTSSKLQMQKLEMKVSVSDQTLAEREESIERLTVMVREGERRMKEMASQLEESTIRRVELEDLEREWRARERKAKLDSSRLTDSLNEMEEEIGRVEREKRISDEEICRLEAAGRVKEEQVQAAEARVSLLSGECEHLERESEQLNSQLGRMEGEAGRRGRGEQELQGRIEQLQRELNDRNQTNGASSEQVEQINRQLVEVEQDRRLLEDRLENSKSVVGDARGEVRELESQMNELKRRLGEAERGRQEAEQKLAQAGCNTGADNYLKEELNKTRKENIGLAERTKELERKVKVLKSEKVERTETVNNYSKMMTDHSTERVVRTQIPLLSGRSGGKLECGEHMVRIRILEQEVERHLRRVGGLEQQLSELEQQHRERSEQLLQERKVERERDHTRHAASLKQLEHSLNSRERMYKERISGLEEQVNLLRDQISKEARSRRSYISSSQVLSNDVSELRRQLDQSLDLVQHSSRAGLEGGLLEREANRLEQTIARQGREVVSRITPSKRGLSPARERQHDGERGRSSSMDNIGMIITSTPVGLGARERQVEPSMRSPLTPLINKHSEVLSRSGDILTRRSGGIRRGLTPDFDRLANVTT